ncbi:MAG: PfkB family carbohydrate kinase [Chloroflexota bacterium]
MASQQRPVQPRRPRVIVLGDLMVDVVMAPGRALESGTDVPGRVRLRQGGSAANTAVWLARLGVRAELVCAVGRDRAGRALVDSVRGDGVIVRGPRVAGSPSGRIGVVVAPGGERSFVADRGAADDLDAADLRPAWFERIDLLHLPAYSLLGLSLGAAGRRAVSLARAAGGMVTVDLSSSGPLLADGRRAARDLIRSVAPDLIFATVAEVTAFIGSASPEVLLDIAPAAVIKRGAQGATIVATDGDHRLRFEVATRPIAATDTTGAGDAFDAGFIVGWLAALAAGRPTAGALQQAALAGHRVAARHLVRDVGDLPLL